MLILIGFPRTGKSFISSQLARIYQLTVCDLDDVILKSIEGSSSVQELFNEVGEDKFRCMERDILKGIDIEKYNVLSPGGGACFFPDSLVEMQRMGKFYYLYRDKKVLEETYKLSGRPLVVPEDLTEFDQFYENRHSFYQRLADKTLNLDTTNKDLVLKQLYEAARD